VRVPTIHLNGTSKEALLEQVVAAQAAVCAALHALREAWPNGRDYYPQGPGALREAEAEMNSRCARLDSVDRELGALALAIYEGGHGR